MTEPTQRERLEFALVSGAAATLAQSPDNAKAIAEGIKKLLETLHPLHCTAFKEWQQNPGVLHHINGPFATPERRDTSARDAEAFSALGGSTQKHRETWALPVVDPGPDSLEREIRAKADNGPRVTPADIKAEIASEHYFNGFDGVAGAGYNEACPDGVLRPFTFTAPGSLGLLTFCVLVLRNGTKVVGVNYGAIDPAQHSPERGRQEARAQAVDKVYELLGFRLRDELARPRLTEADSLADLAGTSRPDNPSRS
ncbi:MAG: hypothetical protein J7556_15180 [Acidovorax sp.]|nr:hypothetical protein [Acidovorax sp.]